MKKIAVVCTIITLIIIITACAPVENTIDGFSMGTFFEVTYNSKTQYGSEISAIMDGIDSDFSATLANSAVQKLNDADVNVAISLSDAEYALIKTAFEIAEATNNAYNPAIYPLVKLWGFNPPYNMNGKIPPTDSEIAEVKSLCATTYFVFNDSEKNITKTEKSAEIDLGGIAKGYAVSQIMTFLESKNEKNALVNVGGTIGAVGKDYAIGVTAPRESEYSYCLSFTLQKGEVCATSGDYERFYEKDGVRYHHILDTCTGASAISDVISATVISKDGALSDALATACVVVGVNRAREILEAYGAKAILITNDKKVVSINETIKIKDNDYEIIG